MTTSEHQPKTIALLAVGTRGDVQPFIALALGLQQAGYKPLIISAKNEEAFVRGFGIDFHALNVDIQKIMDNQEIHAMAKGDSPIAFAKSHLEGSKALKQTMVQVQEEIWDVLSNEKDNVEAVIFHPGMQNAFLMAQELGIPSIMASPFPFAATGEYPAILLYGKMRWKGLLGRILNRSSHALLGQLFWMLGYGAAKEFWKRQGKPHIPKLTPPSRSRAARTMLALMGYSQHVLPRPRDWSENIALTGYWMLPEEADWMPPADLVQFLDDGEAPVYVGFGSIKDAATFKATLEIVVQALEQLGRRAVIALGWSSLSEGASIPKSVYLLGSAPHSWLFPRMAAVVHHGGAGTTAAGLLAGKPTVIIPHTADQPAWGLRVWELGVGGKPIPKKKLTASALETSLREALQPKVVAKASEIGEKLRAENGVQNAVQIISKVLKYNSIKQLS